MLASRSARARALLAWAVLAGAGCGIAPVEPDPPDSTAPLVLLAVAGAAGREHAVELRGLSNPLAAAGVRMVVRRGGVEHTRDGTLVVRPCVLPGHGSGAGTLACFRVEMDVHAGDDVEVAAWVPGLDTVRGRTRVPGAFTVSLAPAGGGAPPGSMRVSWTPSAGAVAYLVEVRDWTICRSIFVCERVSSTRTTELSALLPPFPTSVERPLNVTVRALDPNLDTFATTGVPGRVFTQLPLSSVLGGLGVVGSMTRGTPPYLMLPRGP